MGHRTVLLLDFDCLQQPLFYAKNPEQETSIPDLQHIQFK